MSWNILFHKIFSFTTMTSVYDISAKRNDGKSSSLKEDGEGKVILVVNVASKCGLTPQYTALENVYNKYKYVFSTSWIWKFLYYIYNIYTYWFIDLLIYLKLFIYIFIYVYFYVYFLFVYYNYNYNCI